MALSPEEQRIIHELALRHDNEIPELERYDRYYEGTQPLQYMHPDILREVDGRIHPVIVFWPQLVAESREERLDIEGFRLPGEDEPSEELARIWQANDLDNGSSMAHIDALVMRRSYVCVGTNEDDPETPLVTVESPLELFADVDQRTRKIRSALRRTADTSSTGVVKRYGTLYLPNVTIWMEAEGFGSGGWTETDRDEHGVGEVMVEPIVNRQRVRGGTRSATNQTQIRLGRSELDAVIPLSDAACKLATDMMVGAEFVALPLRAIFGIGPDGFKDEQGNSITALQAFMGRAIAVDGSGKEIKGHEWAAAQLKNFGDGIKEIAQMMAAVGCLPPDYLGYSTQNPASAEAGRVAETRLIKRCERIQGAFGDGWEKAARKIMRLATGEWDDDLKRVEVIWRDPSTPTVAAKADAAVKLRQAQIVSLRQTREDLNYTKTQIERMEMDDELEAARSPGGRLAGALDRSLTPTFDDGTGQFD